MRRNLIRGLKSGLRLITRVVELLISNHGKKAGLVLSANSQYPLGNPTSTRCAQHSPSRC